MWTISRGPHALLLEILHLEIETAVTSEEPQEDQWVGADQTAGAAASVPLQGGESSTCNTF